VTLFYSLTLQKVRHNDDGSTGFLYESDVLSWSKTDFSFSYAMPVRLNTTFIVNLICSFSC